MEEINRGDVVELKSGGPKMTVVYKMTSGWKCAWFINGEIRSADFSTESLKKV
ncbi:DUF2158 domain-containing protein [Flavobacterium sp. DGU11]|uniref:DUF2158 domain-containing protein n=1 Tax=Flavobacterium arundinis TaxID=3139143 RepID=A0ABU9HVL9_9FLAO